MVAQVRKDIGYHLSTLAPLAKTERGFHQVSDLVLEEPGRVLERRVEFLDRLAVRLDKGRLVVPRIDVARAAVDKEPDHMFGTGSKMRRSRRHRVQQTRCVFPVAGLTGSEDALLGQKCRQGDGAETASGPAQQLPPREPRHVPGSLEFILALRHGGYSRNSASCEESSAWHQSVRACLEAAGPACPCRWYNAC